MPKSSQKTSELGKNDRQDPFSSQEDMTLDVFIWDYSWHYFLFTSRVVCSAERDFYPPGIPLTHGGRSWSKWTWLLQSFFGSCLSHSSPCVTWNLLFNLKLWLSDVFPPHDPPTIPHCREKGTVLATIFLPLTTPPQVKPSPSVHLGCSWPLGCSACPVWITFQVSNPTSQSPMYFILIFLKIRILITAYLSHSVKHIIEYRHVELNYSKTTAKQLSSAYIFFSSSSISIS